MGTENKNADPNDPGKFRWGGLAFHAGSFMESGDSARRNHQVAVMTAASYICLQEHQLGGEIDSHSSKRGPDEDEESLRRSLGCAVVIMTINAHPGDAHTSRAMRIAHELGVPTFVVYAESDASLLADLLALPNIRGRVVVQGISADGPNFVNTLHQTLDTLRAEIIEKRTKTA